jgi:hypothetical protein
VGREFCLRFFIKRRTVRKSTNRKIPAIATHTTSELVEGKKVVGILVIVEVVVSVVVVVELPAVVVSRPIVSTDTLRCVSEDRVIVMVVVESRGATAPCVLVKRAGKATRNRSTLNQSHNLLFAGNSHRDEGLLTVLKDPRDGLLTLLGSYLNGRC